MSTRTIKWEEKFKNILQTSINALDIVKGKLMVIIPKNPLQHLKLFGGIGKVQTVFQFMFEDIRFI